MSKAATRRVSDGEAQVLTVSDLMVRWRCPRKTILGAIREGRLKAFRIGKRIYRVTLAEVERFESATAERS